MSRRVGRPVRTDDRTQLLTFYPEELRQNVKILAATTNTSMSDYLDNEINKWLSTDQHQNAIIHRTHPRRKDDKSWVSVQLVLNNNTLQKLHVYAKSRDVSMASLIYTITKNITEINDISK